MNLKTRRNVLTALLIASVVAQSTPVFAKKVNNNPTGDEHTTIGIMESATTVGQASFEVPLYVTTAAIANQTNLMCPEGYDIKNTSIDPDAHDIGVLTVSVESVGTWSTTQGTPGTDKEVKLTIGDLVLPVVTPTSKTATVDIRTQGKKTVFYGKTKGKTDKVTAIKKGETLAQAANGIAPGTDGYKGLDITGEVQAASRGNTKAAAQFKVTYVVSALDDNGDPIGNTYVGDNNAAAGLN